jgi:hypothetical protein
MRITRLQDGALRQKDEAIPQRRRLRDSRNFHAPPQWVDVVESAVAEEVVLKYSNLHLPQQLPVPRTSTRPIEAERTVSAPRRMRHETKPGRRLPSLPPLESPTSSLPVKQKSSSSLPPSEPLRSALAAPIISEDMALEAAGPLHPTVQEPIEHIPPVLPVLMQASPVAAGSPRSRKHDKDTVGHLSAHENVMLLGAQILQGGSEHAVVNPPLYNRFATKGSDQKLREDRMGASLEVLQRPFKVHSLVSDGGYAIPLRQTAEQFDKQHERLSSEASRLLSKLTNDATSLGTSRQLDVAVAALRGNRYRIQPLRLGALISPRYEVQGQLILSNDGNPRGPAGPWRVPTKIFDEDIATAPVQQARKRQWQLKDSIWAPRRKWSDSRDFLDTPACLQKALEADWRMARSGGSLDKFILKHHVSNVEASAMIAEMKRSVFDKVFEVLLRHSEDLYSIFDAYAMQGGGDFTHIQFNSFKDLLADCHLIDEDGALCGSRWDELFVAINATCDKSDVYNHKKGFNRNEFIEFIVRAAIMQHCQQGGMVDVPLAVDTLVTTDIVTRLRGMDPLALVPANSFRERCCYTEETSDVLEQFAYALKPVFEAYAYGSGAVGDQTSDNKLLGLDEFKEFLGDFGAIDSQFCEREANECFVKARMRVAVESERRGRVKLLQLSFEDFLESLVRIASIKAFPTDTEVHEAGCIDGGQYLVQLAHAGGSALSDFLETHDVPRSQPMIQPIHRAVEHLLTLVFRVMMLSVRPTETTSA